MNFTRDLTEFYRTNDGECRAFIISRIGFNDRDILNDLMQSVYLDIQDNDSLVKYDPNKGMKFESYIYRLISWRLRRDAAANCKRIDIDVLEKTTDTLQETLNDYMGFLHNTGVSCTGLYEINEGLKMRLINGKTTKELPQSFCRSHRLGLQNYHNYNQYGITGVLNTI